MSNTIQATFQKTSTVPSEASKIDQRQAVAMAMVKHIQKKGHEAKRSGHKFAGWTKA